MSERPSSRTPDAPARFEPPASELTEPFWEATRRRELLLQWCGACDAVVHYPREVCPACLGTDLEWRPASGRGTVYATSVMHKPAHPGLADRVPYTVALVDLEEGARLMTNIVGGDAPVGTTVVVTWEELSDGRALPLFSPEVQG